MPEKSSDSLKTRIIDEAFRVIEEQGVDNLSFREIARRLGVSHQAPYKHFPSKDHILAAVVARCYASFAQHLQDRPICEDPFEDLGHMGMAYLSFAKAHPLQYRLMFNTRLPDVTEHPEMLEKAQHAFALLRDRLKEVNLRDPEHQIEDPVKHDALFIWSALHGLASIYQSDAISTIELSEEDYAIAVERLMRRLSMALNV